MSDVPPPPQQPPWGGPPGPPPGPAYPGSPNYPGYGYVPPKNNSNAIAALCCAIGAWMVCPIVPAIVALVLANNAEREIKASGGTQTGEGLAQAAKIVSWIHLALIGAVIVLFVLIAVVGSSSQ